MGEKIPETDVKIVDLDKVPVTDKVGDSHKFP